MGSLISLRNLERILEVLTRCKGKVLVGGNRMTGTSSLDDFDFSQGSFLEPTVVVDITPEDELWQEEVFGPVLVVAKFKVKASFLDKRND
jgi:acyl-CoA reductase-like NAD-dependent aldehyde dehydrogenase